MSGQKKSFLKKHAFKWDKMCDDMLAQFQQSDPELTKDFLLMMVKLNVIDTKNKFLLRQPAVPMEMERLKKMTIDRFKTMSKINKSTIKLQLYYKEKIQSRDKLLDELRKKLDEKVEDFMGDMISSVPKHKRHYDLYFHKMVAATIIYSRMGYTNDLTVIKETEVALTSIFSKEDIPTVRTLDHADREKELKQIILMATGVRLYNKEIDDSLGAGIEDYTSTIPYRIAEIAQLTNDMRVTNVKRVIHYTTLIQPYFMTVEIINKNGRRDISSTMVWIRQGLIMAHQVVIYLKQLTDELVVEEANCNYVLTSYERTLEDLKTMIKDHSSLPTHVVAPKFVELADLWDKLFEAWHYVNAIGEIASKINEICDDVLKDVDHVVNKLLGNMKVPHEKEFFDYPQFNIPNDTKAVASKKEFKPEMDILSMEYCGFCVYSLVKGMGLVVLPNPHLGVYSWGGREYMLSSPEAVIEFRRNPAAFVDKVIHFVRRWPTLIHLLRMEKDAFNANFMGDGDENNVAATALVTKQIEVQTDVHPMESNIVEGYSWNEFELRRKGIVLSRVHKCRTHGTQTHWQGLLKNETTQTYQHKNAKIQSNANVSTSLPMNQFFIMGLRGMKDPSIPPHVIELVAENAFDYGCLCSTKVKPKKRPNKAGAAGQRH